MVFTAWRLLLGDVLGRRRFFVVIGIVFVGRLHGDFMPGIVCGQGVGLAFGTRNRLAVAQPFVGNGAFLHAVAVSHGRRQYAAHFGVSADGDGAFFVRGRRIVAAGKRGVVEGAEGDFLRCRCPPFVRRVSRLVGPQVEVHLLVRCIRDVACAFDLVKYFAVFRVAQGPGDFVGLPFEFHADVFDVFRPGVARPHFDAIVSCGWRIVGEDAFQGRITPARNFDAVDFAVACHGRLRPFIGEEAEDGVGVKFTEVGAEGGLISAVTHRVAGDDFRSDRGFTVRIGQRHVHVGAVDLRIAARPVAAAG